MLLPFAIQFNKMKHRFMIHSLQRQIWAVNSARPVVLNYTHEVYIVSILYRLQYIKDRDTNTIIFDGSLITSMITILTYSVG